MENSDGCFDGTAMDGDYPENLMTSLESLFKILDEEPVPPTQNSSIISMEEADLMENSDGCFDGTAIDGDYPENLMISLESLFKIFDEEPVPPTQNSSGNPDDSHGKQLDCDQRDSEAFHHQSESFPSELGTPNCFGESECKTEPWFGPPVELKGEFDNSSGIYYGEPRDDKNPCTSLQGSAEEFGHLYPQNLHISSNDAKFANLAMQGSLIDGKPIITLPSKTITLKRVDFSKEERNFYLALEAESREQFKVYEDAGTLKQNYMNILLMLLRLRQSL